MAQCRACGQAIRFELTAKGKHQPVSLQTGESHFIDCPQAARFRKPAPPQDVCLGCGSTDLDHLPGQGPHYGAIKCRDCGQHRWLRRPQETKA